MIRNITTSERNWGKVNLIYLKLIQSDCMLLRVDNNPLFSSLFSSCTWGEGGGGGLEDSLNRGVSQGERKPKRFSPHSNTTSKLEVEDKVSYLVSPHLHIYTPVKSPQPSRVTLPPPPPARSTSGSSLPFYAWLNGCA